MENLKTFIKGILAGIAISFGGFLCIRTNIQCSNGIIGPMLFSFGLILICNFGFNLYTGKVCYLFDNNDKKILFRLFDLLLMLVGNLVGTLFFSTILRLVIIDNSLNNLLLENLKNTVNSKINYDWYQMIGLSFFCGILVYIAVEGFKNINNNFGKYVVLIFAIGGFIISGFEHSIANMFYYFLSGNFSLMAFASLGLCVIGNSIGGLFIPMLNKILNYKKNNEVN